jgi:Tfp pilus assembly pilus retraction ATPase PilT
VTSRVGALVRSFLQTDGDALYLVAGEKIFITRGTTRTVAGREVVSEEAFRVVAEEIVPGVPSELLAQKRNRIPYLAGEGLPPVEIHFATVAGRPAMMIVRTGRGPGGEEPQVPAARETETPVAPAAVPGESPAAPGSMETELPGATPSTHHRGAVALGPLLVLARGQGASDLFISPGERPLFRLQGSLVASGTAPCRAAEIELFLSNRAPARAARSLLACGSARFVLEIEGAGRCLIRVVRDRKGTGLAVRLLLAEAPQLETLGLPEAVSRLAGPAPGLLLVAGPPGSGRTTVLAALAAHAAQGRAERVVSVEDPVELVIPPGRGGVSQRESGTDVPSVRAGLRDARTEDADVVLAGTVPDAASAALLVELAASGRLVLAPAPAPSLTLALQWLDALLPEGRRVELRALLSATFRGGLALALCRGRTGERVAAAESLHPGSLASEMIVACRLATLSSELGASPGYVTLNSSLAGLVAEGLVEPREALLRSLDRPALLARLREEGAALPPELLRGSPGGAPEA